MTTKQNKIIPWNSGLDSTEEAIAKRATRLIRSLSDELNDYVLKQGEVTEKIREFRLYLIDTLKNEGWRYNNNKILKPKN